MNKYHFMKRTENMSNCIIHSIIKSDMMYWSLLWKKTDKSNILFTLISSGLYTNCSWYGCYDLHMIVLSSFVFCLGVVTLPVSVSLWNVPYNTEWVWNKLIYLSLITLWKGMISACLQYFGTIWFGFVCARKMCSSWCSCLWHLLNK